MGARILLPFQLPWHRYCLYGLKVCADAYLSLTAHLGNSTVLQPVALQAVLKQFLCLCLQAIVWQLYKLRYFATWNVTAAALTPYQFQASGSVTSTSVTCSVYVQ